MTVDIVIKSYPADYPWLAYCLRSIQKFASGFNNIIVLLPRSAPLTLTAETVVYLDVEENYMTQQVAKLNADFHTEADFILHIDSDCIFKQPVTPETFMVNGKARWLMTPWADCPDAEKAWMHVMVKCCRTMPTHDFMRKSTLIVPRWAYAEFRSFIQKTHGVTMDAYVMNQPGRDFSEYNCLGHYLYTNHRDRIHWHDTAVSGHVPQVENQEWSWGGLTSEIKAKLDTLLK